MDDIHISRELLRAVDDGRVPMDVLDAIKTEHLLSRCPHCRAEVEAYRADRRARTSVLSRFLQIVSTLLGRLVSLGSGEVGRAERDLKELLLLPLDARTRHIERARSRYRSPVLVQLLLEESRRHASLQPTMSFHMAELAETVANRNPAMPGYFELLALAKAQMANAYRVGNDRRQAKELFAVARQIMADYGVTDPEVVGRVDELTASLYKDQRQFQDAERLLKRAALQFGLVQATDDAARVLIILGDNYCAAGSPDQAIETTRSALALLGAESDLRLLVAGHYNLAFQLVEAGRFTEASTLLEEDAALFDRVQEDWLQLRLLWLRGDIAAGQGNLAAAERAYLETRDGFVAHGMEYDAAIVSLDLAILYLRQGRTADVRQLAEEMLPIFQTQDVHREALAALSLFQETARQDQLTLDKALQVAAFLREARNEPALRFAWEK
jgi:tetratricopeptide (TPR) repeat protein